MSRIGRMFSTTFTKAELLPADVTVSAGVPVRLAELDVPLGKVYAWGRGVDLGLEDTEGRIYIDLRDNGVAPGAEVQGTIRLVAINQLGQEEEVYWEGRTEQLRLGTNVLNQRMILPALEPVVPAGYKIAIVVIADSNVTIGSANSTILIDGRRARRLGV